MNLIKILKGAFLATSLLVLAACGGPTLDGSSDEALEASEVALSEAEGVSFYELAQMVRIVREGVRLESGAGRTEEEIRELELKKLDGMSLKALEAEALRVSQISKSDG